ncbi:MAG: hypothetical protein HY000_34055 [Planctomycetes bacterium]|nr:hypothetical protein [Planctomycetota bacterium]
MRTFLALLSLPWFLALTASAAELSVSNRLPNPNEVGYRPADGAEATLNPPPFIWLHEPEAASYTIQWATQQDFGNAETVCLPSCT